MINIDMLVRTPEEIMKAVAHNAKLKRKRFKLTQKELASKAGVTYSSYKRFEQTGNISFDSFVRITAALDSEAELLSIFTERHYDSIEEIINGQS